MRWHTFLWAFQSLRWCSREQYPTDPHAAHFCFAASEQDGRAHCIVKCVAHFFPKEGKKEKVSPRLKFRSRAWMSSRKRSRGSSSSSAAAAPPRDTAAELRPIQKLKAAELKSGSGVRAL
jgi:hypothetical protein